MRAIANTGPGTLEMLEWPTPRPGPEQVLVRVAACGICATDLQMIDGWDRTGFPSVPGHEWSGTVEAVGPGVDEGWVGCRVVAENVLSDGGEVGFEYPGGYGEYLVTEALRLQVLPSRLSFPTATLIEPLAVCVRGIRRLRPEGRGRVLVWGDGPIGLLTVALLRRAGIDEIWVVGGRAGRLQAACDLGATAVLNYHELGQDLAQGVASHRGTGLPSIVEASGSAAALQASLDLAAPGGRVLLLGDYGGAQARFDWNVILHRELELVGSCASAGAWEEAVQLTGQDQVPLSRLVTHTLPAERFADGISLAQSRDGDVIKVVLTWPGAAHTT